MILTKDKGFKAAGKIIGKVRKLHGIENSDFLDKYFESVWNNLDKDHNNQLAADQVEDFFNNMLAADKP